MSDGLDQPHVDFMSGAWAAFVSWAVTEPSIRAQFNAETPFVLIDAPANPIDAMVDEACGVNEQAHEALVAFVEWVTREHWGIDEAPPLYRQHLLDKAARP